MATTAQPDGAIAAENDATSSTYPPPKLAWFTMVMIGSVTIFGQMDRAIFYLLVADVKEEFAFTDTQMSVLMGVAFSGAYLMCGLPIARLTDVWRRKIILPSALAVWSFGTLLCSFAGSFVQLFVARSVVGSGESVKGPCSVSLISDLFERKHLPRAFAFYQFVIRLGESLALIVGGFLIGWFTLAGPITLPLVGEMTPWRMVMLVFALPGIFFALSFVLTVKEPKRQARERRGSVPIKEVLHFLFKSDARYVLLPVLIGAAVNSIENVGVASWVPVFYERTYGWTPDQYGPLSGTVNLIVAPFALVVGAWITERMIAAKKFDANMRLVLWTQALALPLAAIGPLMPSFWLAFGCSVASLGIQMASTPAALAAMQVVTPNELRGQVNALYMLTISVLGQGLGPTAVALLTDFVFQNEADLRYAMVTAGLIANPISLYLVWRTLKPYGLAYRKAEGLA